MITLHKTLPSVLLESLFVFLLGFDEAGDHAGGPTWQGFTVEFLQVFLAD